MGADSEDSGLTQPVLMLGKPCLPW